MGEKNHRLSFRNGEITADMVFWSDIPFPALACVGRHQSIQNHYKYFSPVSMEEDAPGII